MALNKILFVVSIHLSIATKLVPPLIIICLCDLYDRYYNGADRILGKKKSQ